MMTKKVLIMLFLVALFSCKKEEVVQKIHFNISVEGFELKDRHINNKEDIPNIVNEFAGIIVTCTNDTETFVFDTNETGIENFLFELPVGIYNIKVETPAASFFGQSTPTFTAQLNDVEIADLTDTIEVVADPTCALIVVNDEKNQLENGAFIIEDRSFSNEDFISYPLVHDSVSKLYYTYITPDTIPDIPNAFLWFYSGEQGEEKGGLHTEVFEIGYKYLIKVWE